MVVPPPPHKTLYTEEKTFLDTYTYLMKEQVWTYIEYQALASLNMCREFQGHLQNKDYTQALSVLYEKGERFFIREVFQALSAAVIYDNGTMFNDVLQYFFSTKVPQKSFCAWGNSHLVPLFSVQKNIYDTFEVMPFVFSITGASASGLPKLTSTYNLFEKIQLAIDRIHPQITFLNFGQVDVEIGIYYKKIVQSKPIEPYAFIDDIVDKYITCIQTLDAPICLLPIGLPSIKNEIAARNVVQRAILHQITDATMRDAYTKELVAVYPSYQERLTYAVSYNQKLFDRAKQYDVDILDTQGFFCKKRKVRNIYCSSYDPHYTTSLFTRNVFTAYLLSKKIQKISINIFAYMYSLYKIWKAFFVSF